MSFDLAWRGRPWSMVCGPLRVALWNVGAGFGIRGPLNWWSTISGFAWMGSSSGVLCVRVSWGLVGFCGQAWAAIFGQTYFS